MMRIKDIMSRDVETVRADESAENACKLMNNRKIQHLVVLEGREVVGVLSKSDLVDRLYESSGMNIHAYHESRLVSDLMTADIITADPETPVRDAANNLRGFGIGSIPVLARGKLVGIITLSDLLEWIGRKLERTALLPERRPVRDIPPYLKPGHPPIT